jgi:hypothetical protein
MERALGRRRFRVIVAVVAPEECGPVKKVLHVLGTSG